MNYQIKMGILQNYINPQNKAMTYNDMNPVSWTKQKRGFCMTKICYEEKINLYYDRKNGMSFPSIKSKYGINKSGVEYLVRLIDKHGFDILRTNENKSYSSNEKE